MKKIISVLLIAALACGFLASCGGSGNVATPAGMKLISGENDAYNLFVPSKWIVNSIKGICSAYHNEADTSNISITSFLVLESDPVASTSVPVSSETPDTSDVPDTTEAVGTEAVTEETATGATTGAASEKKSKRETYIDRYWKKCVISYTEELNGFKIIEAGEKTKLGGLEAKKYIYTATYGGVEYKMMKIVTEFGGLMYIFEYTAKVENYDSNMSDVNWIISEFKFKDGIS